MSSLQGTPRRPVGAIAGELRAAGATLETIILQAPSVAILASEATDQVAKLVRLSLEAAQAGLLPRGLDKIAAIHGGAQSVLSWGGDEKVMFWKTWVMPWLRGLRPDSFDIRQDFDAPRLASAPGPWLDRDGRAVDWDLCERLLNGVFDAAPGAAREKALARVRALGNFTRDPTDEVWIADRALGPMGGYDAGKDLSHHRSMLRGWCEGVGALAELLEADLTPARDTIAHLGNYVYEINGTRGVVTANQDALLQAFLKQNTMNLPEATRASGLSSSVVCRVLTELENNYAGIFGVAIKRPGQRGRGGYTIAVTPRLPVPAADC